MGLKYCDKFYIIKKIIKYLKGSLVKKESVSRMNKNNN